MKTTGLEIQGTKIERERNGKMRITHKMIIDRVTSNLGNSFGNYLNLSQMASSGRRINKPSDDPTGITKALSYRSYLKELQQFRRNIDRADALLSFSDHAFDSIGRSLIEAEDIAVRFQNATFDEHAREAAAQQVMDILNQVLEDGNSTLDGRHIFAGTSAGLVPFDFNGTGVIYQGDNDPYQFQIERDLEITANITGDEFLVKPSAIMGDGFDLNPALMTNTLLSTLHAGEGVDLGDNQFILRTVNGTATIDLTGVLSVGEVITEVNTQAAAQGLTNLTCSISPSNNCLRLEDTSDPYITMDTPFDLLNNGAGVDLTVPGFDIIDGIGTTWTIDLTGATTVGDVINRINLAGIPDLTASITPNENTITITDTAGHDYRIEESPGGTAAADLGIQTSTPITGTFTGTDLEPQLIQTEETGANEKTASELGILFGTSVSVYDGTDLNPRLFPNTKLTDLNNGNGITFSMIHIDQGHYNYDVDLSSLESDPNATVRDLMNLLKGSGAKIDVYMNEDKTGIALESTISNQSLVIYDTVEDGAAWQLGIAGSPDLIGSLLYLKHGLEHDWANASQKVLDKFESSQQQILTLRSVVGSRINRIQSAYDRNLNHDVYATKLSSEIEDADMIWVVTEMATREAMYQAALQASAQVIQPSLVNFIR